MFRNILVAIWIVIAMPIFTLLSSSLLTNDVGEDNIVINFNETISNSTFEENLDRIVFEDSNVFSTFDN